MLDLEKMKQLIFKHKYISMIVGCVLFLSLLFLFKSDSSNKKTADSNYLTKSRNDEKKKVVSVKEIQKEVFTHKISDVNGKIDVEKTELGFEVAGIINIINAKKGSYVKKGDVIAELQGVNLYLKVKYKQNEWEAAKIELKKAENIFSESKEKAETGYILERRLEDERLEVELKKNKVKAAELEFESAKENYTKIKLKAPFNGVVMEKKVGAGQNVDTSKPAFVLLNTGSIYADIEISEIDSYKLRIGQQVVLNTTVDDKPILGEVEAIVPAVQGKAMILAARVKLKTESIKLLPGMFVSGHIIIYQEEGVMSVPVDSMIKENDKSYLFVYDPANEHVSKREVVFGYIGDEETVVKNGLEIGEFVVTDNVSELKDNDIVVLSNY